MRNKPCRTCTYRIERKKAGERYLACAKCGRFYGYIMNDVDLKKYQNWQDPSGLIDFQKVNWRVTDYTQKFTDNQKAKKAVPYNPQSDDMQCSCGKVYFGAECPECGSKRVLRKVQKSKRRR